MGAEGNGKLHIFPDAVHQMKPLPKDGEKMTLQDEDSIFKQWKDIKYFKIYEFDSPDATRSGIGMNIEFVKILDKIRHEFGQPLTINSGYRTKEHNDTLKESVDGSAHTKGLACDIKVDNSVNRFALVKLAMDNGIKRIGIAKTFIHLDMDYDKPQNVIWLYS